MSTDSLYEALVARGGTLATLLVANGADGDGGQPGIGAPSQAARGPRAAGNEAEYELLLEMILEGSLLHYGRPRVVVTDDRDLALLLGDQLYALGLSRLAELGDLEAVRELADVISLLSEAQLSEDSELAGAIWDAGAVAVGWGASPEYEAAKALARVGDAGAVPALVECCGRALDQRL
jgi:PBS lyase HEAT-like repeat